MPRPPKKKKNVEMIIPTSKEASLNSEISLEIKPKKQKLPSKKEIEKMKRMEKEMKEKLIQMKKEAEEMLADYQAMENTAILKAQEEEEQQNYRVKLLTGTCKTFNTAKLRLLHELNKIREEEIWERYTTTDQKPYPESTPNMHTHLYLWQQQKITDNMESVLGKCDTYVESLDVLNELIEYPLYSTKETVANWKELRMEWRREFLERIDKCCFHLIKNLHKNLKQQLDQNHVYTFDYEANHLKLGMSAWTENDNVLPSLKWTPKIAFETMDAEFVMPAAYRQKPFVLRLIYLDRDFFSDNSLTSSPPESLPMETDLLKEINRCFEAKKEAKMSVADREREKVKAAKHKYLAAQEAVNQVEKSFKSFQEQTKEFKPKKRSRESIKSDGDGNEPPVVERRKKHKESLVKIPEQAADSSTVSIITKRRAPDALGEISSNARILLQSGGAMKTLDAISMRSGMRKRQEKMKKAAAQGDSDTDEPTCVFKTRSMSSVIAISTKTLFRRDSELCFEDAELSSEESLKAQKAESYESLDLMLGREDEDPDDDTIPTLRQLIKDTVIVEREMKQQRVASKTASSNYSWDVKKKKGRGKSMFTVDKKLTGEVDDIPTTASDIFEAKEDARQEQYLTSLYFQNIPKKQYHLNLRTYSIIRGIYLLDLISHLPQPHQLTNGSSVQIFYGEMNIKREKYEYNYTPPPPPEPDDDPDVIVPDHGLQHLLHVKIPLPKNVAYFERPEVALWDGQGQFWTNEHVHKLDINMEKYTATFSLSTIMPFAICTKKFSLLPYVSWSLTPKHDTGGVSLTLRTVFATIEFHVLNFKVSLARAVSNEEQDIAQVEDIIGKEMQLHKLIAVMKSRGVNVFPDEDTCLYTENSAKDTVLEEHTNLCIAMWSDNLEFQAAEWNGDFKRRKIAFRVRESVPYSLALRYRTIVASCLSATIYRLGAEDTSFDESKQETYGFCPDVQSLLEKAFIHVVPSNPLNPLQVLCVYSLLCRTKVHSYCGTNRKETLYSFSDEKAVKKRQKKQIKQKNRKATTISSGEESLQISEHSSVMIL